MQILFKVKHFDKLCAFIRTLFVHLEIPIHSLRLIGLHYMEKSNKHWLKVLAFPETLKNFLIEGPRKIKDYFLIYLLNTPMAFLPYRLIQKFLFSPNRGT